MDGPAHMTRTGTLWVGAAAPEHTAHAHGMLLDMGLAELRGAERWAAAEKSARSTRCEANRGGRREGCLLYTSPSPRDRG
eukprot:469453-Rhodomonas_salina.1